jgi:hypothetical protein
MADRPASRQADVLHPLPPLSLEALRRSISMARRQQSTPKDAIVPFLVRTPEQDGTPGQDTRIVYVRNGDVLALCDLLLDARAQGRAEARAELGTSWQRKRSLDTERFKRGLLLVKWIDYFGKGKLTKNLLTEIRKGCKDWPEVRAYQEDKRPEKLRSALRALAEDTRQALRDRRLPAGWSFGPPPTP